MIKNFYIKNNKNSNGGLTLIELLVVISIFLVITSVTIFNYGDFRSNVSLQNISDSIALSIRKAQSYAIGARSKAGSTSFDYSYGIHFSLSTTNTAIQGNNKAFLIFTVPTTSTKKYDYTGTALCGDSSNQCNELLQINTADYVKEFIVDNSVITSSSALLDIVFTRPNPRAEFCYRSSSGASCVSASSVSIIISNGQPGTKEKLKTISVQSTGQINVQ